MTALHAIRLRPTRPALRHLTLGSFLVALSLSPVRPLHGGGLLVGDPFRVNTVARDSQVFPTVASNDAGASVVAWACQDASSWGICAQRYNGAGQAAGGELSVNVYTAGIQQFPAAAIAANGRFVVAWESAGQDGDDWGVYARRFSANGEPLGGEIRANVETRGRQRYPAVTMLPGGGFVVAWESNQVPSRFEDVYARIFDAKGKPIGGEIRVNATDRTFDVDAAVASRPDDGFVVAWRGGKHIYVRRFSSGGAPAGGEIQVSQFQGELKSEPAVGSDAAGGFVVAWESDLQDGDDYGIYARRFGAGGGALGPEQRINQTTERSQRHPALAVSPEGDFAIAWDSWEQTAPNTFSVLARTFDAQGIPYGGEQILGERSMRASAAIDADGDLFFTWQSAGPEIEGRRMLIERGECRETAYALCLNDRRFKLESAWRTPDGEEGGGRVESLTADTGYVWFLRRTNVEVVVKVLDGCGVNAHRWLFAAGLTNLEVDLVVTDTESGEQRRFHNPQGKPFAPLSDTSAFTGCGAGARASLPGTDAALWMHTLLAAETATEPMEVRLPAGSGEGHACTSGASRLCLGDDRFALEVDWQAGGGGSGKGRPRSLTADTGLFWFFDRDNLEVVVKVLDGCGVNGRYWVFAAGLTDLGVDLRVSDTRTGASRRYSSRLGSSFTPIQDTSAFPCQ